ncbi:hypothetical protein H5201_09340 [Pseudoalteromonas sp. SG43-6]|uniref:hypothetical protein n=1 Tax=Pseudoalteromonas sp. SG43-6 TaxID=2760967 RepID=UPI0016029EE3|nr:hypothetical protein [Pseudoalteromonas sp. SG43-6]MBB1434511.1 hypothetical protein [Pseudoalteromonas sp. SG43-6]
MNFNEQSFNDLDNLAVQRLIFEDGDELTSILKGHLFIEKALESAISKNLPNPKVFFKKRRTFELKLDLANAMDLLDHNLFSAIKAANNIRNNYSHNDGYSVALSELNSLKYNWSSLQKEAFNGACQNSTGEAVKISMLFLCWAVISLVAEPI